MNTTSSVHNRPDIQLSPSAPLVRVTAGVGSAGQKTWNLRRPVTLIGARRPAHIVLHDNDVSVAHCVIVNTGREVLLKDLYSAQGTICNQDKVELAVLSDGDVITIGATKIQVAIRVDSECNGDSGASMKYADPTKLTAPVTIRFDHADREWRVEDAVTLIGRHPDAKIHLNMDDVERRHAVLFSFGDELAIFDLAGRAAVGINGHPCGLGGLRNGDRIGIGPLALQVACDDVTGSDASVGDGESATQIEEPSTPEANDVPNAPAEQPSDANAQADQSGNRDSSESANGNEALNARELNAALGELENELNSIETNITSSWQQLNGWQVQGDPEDAEVDARLKSLDAREVELNERDAVIRGQLHDVARYHEQVFSREKELQKQLAEFQEEIDNLSAAKAELEARDKDITRRVEEMRRREHVVAQRWSRLQRASCPHCGKPVNVDS